MQTDLFSNTETMEISDIHWNSDIITEDGYIKKDTKSFVDIFSFSVDTPVGQQKVKCDTGCSSMDGDMIYYNPHLSLQGQLASKTGYLSIFIYYNLTENTAIMFDDIVNKVKEHFSKQLK